MRLARRNFLKSVAVVLVAPALPTPRPEPAPEVNIEKVRDFGGSRYIDPDAPAQWKNYCSTYVEPIDEKMLEQFRRAFRNTKFRSPVTG